MFALDKAYDPNQPRDPKGSPTGGRWTRAGAAPAEDAGVKELRAFLGMTSGMGSKLDKFLLDHGRAYKITPATFVGGVPQQCYKNAALAALESKTLTYVEGYVSVHGVPIHHAWVADKFGNVIDVTIADKSAIRGYFGVPVKDKWLMTQLSKRKRYGVLVHENYDRVMASKPEDIVAKADT